MLYHPNTKSEIKNLFKFVKYKHFFFFLKHRAPIMHRQIFRIISQNPEHVKTHCNDLNNPFHFACRRWTLDNQLN